MTCFGISLNLNLIAATQYRNFNFNSMCVFNSVPLAANSSGIFSLDDADTDNETDIDAYIEFPTTDFGILNAKRFRKMYFGYETSGSIQVSVNVDGTTSSPFNLTTSETGQVQHRGILSLSREQKGTYWTLIIENVEGCDFSLDNIEGLPIILTKGHR